MKLNIFKTAALRSRFCFLKRKVYIGSGITIMIFGVIIVLIFLCPIFAFKGLYKIVNKFFN